MMASVAFFQAEPAAKNGLVDQLAQAEEPGTDVANVGGGVGRENPDLVDFDSKPTNFLSEQTFSRERNFFFLTSEFQFEPKMFVSLELKK